MNGTPSSSFGLRQARAWLCLFQERVLAEETLLTALDAAIGDGDHGTNMARGLNAVVEGLEASAPDTLEALFRAAGLALVSAVGGASGPLYGTFFLRCAAALGPKPDVEGTQLAAALRAGLEGIVQRGKAAAGDKTLIDALHPGLEAFEAALSGGAPLRAAALAASTAAARGRDGTEPLIARRGRAAYLGERSIGHIDPGAASMALLLEALAAALTAA